MAYGVVCIATFQKFLRALLHPNRTALEVDGKNEIDYKAVSLAFSDVSARFHPSLHAFISLGAHTFFPFSVFRVI